MNGGAAILPDDPILAEIIRAWDPTERAVHCSNCPNCIVSGDGVRPPAVHCAKALQRGEPVISLWRLLRKKNPAGFRKAADCPGFESMD